MKTIGFAISLFGVLFVITGFAQTDRTIRDLTVQGFKLKMDELANEVIIDLRTPEELRSGVIPNATNFDYFEKNFEAQIKRLDKSQVYLLYCASGVRSAETLELMERSGFTAVFNLVDGFNGWKKAKMPIEPFSKP
jgi:rhodanese-related sulfurtransferase